MSQSKLLYRITAKQASVVAAAAILGMITILSAFFLVSDSASNSYATSVNSEITAEVDGTHYVTLSAPDVTFSINPTDSAQLSKQSINVSVKTNAPGGADLYLSMANNTNALHLNGDTTIPDYRDTIPNLPGAADSSEQPAKAPARTLLSHKKLESLREHLGERDLAILTAIRMSKYLTSDQVRRLYFIVPLWASIIAFARGSPKPTPCVSFEKRLR